MDEVRHINKFRQVIDVKWTEEHMWELGYTIRTEGKKNIYLRDIFKKRSYHIDTQNILTYILNASCAKPKYKNKHNKSTPRQVGGRRGGASQPIAGQPLLKRSHLQRRVASKASTGEPRFGLPSPALSKSVLGSSSDLTADDKG